MRTYLSMTEVSLDRRVTFPPLHDLEIRPSLKSIRYGHPLVDDSSTEPQVIGKFTLNGNLFGHSSRNSVLQELSLIQRKTGSVS